MENLPDMNQAVENAKEKGADILAGPKAAHKEYTPEEIEKIHWTASGHIPEKSLFNTALNVFESYDNPTINSFIELLKEEYPQDLITKNTFKINRIWEEATERVKFIKQVNDVYILAKQNGLDITKDKNETMRFMSKHFSRNIMGKVGTVILKQAGLIKEKRP